MRKSSSTKAGFSTAWSRYRACQAVRVEPRFREFAGDDPLAYVLSKNVQRRHMSPVQILKVLEVARAALEAEAVARKRAALRVLRRPWMPLGGIPPNGGRVSERGGERGSDRPKGSNAIALRLLGYLKTDVATLNGPNLNQL